MERGDPLPGTAGFAGLVDGALARDVLGRELVYADREPAERDGQSWSFDPGDLTAPELLPAGHVRPLREDPTGEGGGAGAGNGGRAVWTLPDPDPERDEEGAVAATGRTNAMDVGIAVPLYLVAERVAADGYDRLALGQGADELFGGYAKVARAPEDPRVEADTVRAARRETMLGLPDQLERDLRVLRAAGVEPVAPLLHDRVVRAALALPGDLLVAGDERKVAFRRAVRAWVPEPAATREKKALQYGSLVARELDRLARQDGFKRRLNDHVRKYVEALTDA
ncbi:asparagine synthase [Halobacteriales archaeon QH_3_68_24]|nr:MAG: asparagine synthase [Halobacteriales archaeon QH_3_68_24]